MNFVIAGLLECISVVKRNSKTIYWIFAVLLALLMCGNTSTPDRYAYALGYNTITGLDIHGSFDIGFQIMMLISKACGLSFQCFVGLISVISLLIMSKAIMNLSHNPVLVMCAYFFYPFVLDGEQIRSFLGTSLALLGISYVLKEQRNGLKKYIILCILAGLIQASCLFFLLYGCIFFSRRIVKWITIIGCIIFIGFRDLVIWFISLFGFINMNKVTGYFEHSAALSNWYIYVIFYLLIFFTMMFLIKKQKWDIYNQKQNINLNIAYKLNILSLVLLVLLYLNPNLERLFRLILLVDYCVMSNYIGAKITKCREVVFLLFMLVLPGSRFIAYLLGGGWDNYIVPYFIEGFHFVGN